MNAEERVAAIAVEFNDPRPGAGSEYLDELREIALGGSAAIALLRSIVTTNTSGVLRRRAAAVLGECGIAAEAAVTDLLDVITNPKPGWYELAPVAATSLGNFSAQAPRIVPCLRQAMEQTVETVPNYNFFSAVAASLAKLAPGDMEAVRVISLAQQRGYCDARAATDAIRAISGAVSA